MSNFHVGQKVVYVGWDKSKTAGVGRRDVGDSLFDEDIGKVYTLRWVGAHEFLVDKLGNVAEQGAVKLEGVTRITQSRSDMRDVQRDVPWGAMLFRPVQEKSQSTELLQTIVAGGPVIDQGGHLDKRVTKKVKS